MAARHVRDNKLLDAVEALAFSPFNGNAWRVVRDGRNPLTCSATGGRWDDGTFEVLYTSTRGDGAIGEMFFHVGLGQPVIPSRARYRLYELRVTLAACVRMASLEQLAALGMKTGTFGRLSYTDRQREYPGTQEIAEAAQFHGRDGILVPSARSEHPNLVVFCGAAGPDAAKVVKDHGLIDWDKWKQAPLGY